MTFKKSRHTDKWIYSWQRKQPVGQEITSDCVQAEIYSLIIRNELGTCSEINAVLAAQATTFRLPVGRSADISANLLLNLTRMQDELNSLLL